MTEFETRLIRRLIDRFEAALRVAPARTVPAEDEPDPEPRLPGPEELDLYLVLRATVTEHDPERPEHLGRDRGGVVSYNGHVYYAFDDWRVGVFREVPTL